METVTMDFSFPMTSAEYGRFLVACHNHLPGINISHVETYHAYSPGRAIVSVSVPENIAVLLKLEFGGSVVKRSELDMSLVKMKILKDRNTLDKKYIVMNIQDSFDSFNFKKDIFKEGLIIKNKSLNEY